MYTVYKHTSPSGKVYIGITSRKPEVRWGNGRNYVDNEYFTRAINKYGWDNIEHEILFAGLSKEDAERKEIELIKEYRSTDRAFGYNIENGGSALGKHSEYTKQKISESLKGERNPRFGKKFPYQMRNRTVSDTERINRSLSHENQTPVNKRAVIQYEKDGSFLNWFESMTEASNFTNIAVSNISRCANGERKTAGGYKWVFD